MAETLLSNVIEGLIELLAEEVKLLKGVHREVKSLKNELEIIQPFVRDAEARSEKGEVSDATKAWLKQIRQEADRIEDVIDEYLHHLAQHRRRDGFINCMRKAGHLIKNLKLRYKVSLEIQDIKGSLDEIKERGKSYGLRPFETGSSSSVRNIVDEAVDPRLGSLFVDDDELVGIDSSSKELITSLVQGPSTRLVISLVGEGGIGKTTLAKMVYNSEVVKGYFDCYAWITVSQSYNLEKVLKIMKSQIREQSAGEIFTIEQLIILLRNSLQTKRYVIVFDDVWQTNFWDVIKHALPSNNNGSRIIITTRSTIVVDSFKETPCDIVRELKPWSHEPAWELFCKKAFCFEFEGRCPEGLKHLSHEIMSKCKGLPLVIAAVAGLLSTKDKVDHEWRKVLENLSNEFEMNHQLTRIPIILSFSYHDLPYHLKPCYLYFGIFPEDCLIEDKRLFRLWIAEGFIKSKRDKTLEQVAEEYLSELIQRNLVSYELRYGVQRWCMVHDLMREIILTMADESCFSQTLDNNTLVFQEKSRRFSIYGATKDVLKMVGGSKIRSIFLLNTEELSKSFTVTLFENCKLLKVLDFENSSLCTLPKEVGNLFNLKYLSLAGTNVKVLPKTIGELHNLQTLNLCRTLVQELPTEINKLRKLRHLLAYQLNEEIEHSLETYLGVRMHEGVGSLEELQTLTCIAAYSNGVSFMKELEKLRKLVVLRVSELTTEIGKALGTSVEKMNRLQKLHLISASEDEILDLKCISCPPPSLNYLSLRCRLHELPSWVSKIQNLRGLSLCFSRLNNEPLKCLKNLPNLAYLNMYQTYAGEVLHFEEGSFQKLKQLVLRKLEGLKVVKIDKGALPLLEELGFGPFPLMKEIPSDIRHLTNLKSLEMRDMPREAVAGLQPNGGIDYWKIKHIPSVCFGYKHKGDIYDIYKLGSSDLLQRLQEHLQ